MLNAFLFGLLATSSLILGGIIAARFNLKKRFLEIIMAFGAGTLISAVSYELIYEAVKLAKGTGFPAIGLFAGALTFYFSDKPIEKFGSKNRMDAETSHSSSLVVPMLLGIILDGIPESYEHGGKVTGIIMVFGFFVSVVMVILEHA